MVLVTRQKELSFIISEQTLAGKYEVVKDHLESLLKTVSSETELIQNDNLARGRIVTSTSVYASLVKREKGAYWWVNTSPIASEVGEDAPDEYWSSFGLWEQDFVSGTTQYPWMPVPVSELELPF